VLPVVSTDAAMSVSALVAQYGYWVVFFGALAEGETVVLTAGFAAHRGLLQLPLVIGLAFLAATLGDQVAFQLGRRHGARLMSRFPLLRKHSLRLQALLQRHPNAAILSVRFLYGMRTAGPVALGALGVPQSKFVLLNMLSAALWATGLGLLGYQFGNAMQWLLQDLRAAEDTIILGLLATGLAVSAWWWWRHR
jgi:membrane protein DedA with SNARE-associated domain